MCGYDESIERKSLLDLTKPEVEEINNLVERVFKTKEEYQQENAELKAQVELLLSALEVGFSSGEDHDIDVWEEETKALISKLREGGV